jgi:NAD-dependent SIR2 family protein deacetylase
MVGVHCSSCETFAESVVAISRKSEPATSVTAFQLCPACERVLLDQLVTFHRRHPPRSAS